MSEIVYVYITTFFAACDWIYVDTPPYLGVCWPVVLYSRPACQTLYMSANLSQFASRVSP